MIQDERRRQPAFADRAGGFVCWFWPSRRWLSFLAITAVQVVHTASLEEIHPADAIVVFGAAEYSGVRLRCCGRGSITLSIYFTAAWRPSSSPRAAPPPIPLSAKAASAADHLMRHGSPSAA